MRQRDVEVVDLLADGDLGGLGERAEQRQAAVAEVVAAGAVVDEADHLVAELAVLEDAVGDHAAEVAGAGDEDRGAGRCPTRQRRSSSSRTNLRDE